jgi:hypothetical protein
MGPQRDNSAPVGKPKRHLGRRVRAKWFWTIGSGIAIFTGILVLCLCALHLFYVAGLHNNPEPILLAAIGALAWGGGVLVLICGLIVFWRSRTLLWCILHMVLLIGGILMFPVLRDVVSTRGRSHLEGLRNGMVLRADLPEIRMWMKAHPGFSGVVSVGGLDKARATVLPDASVAEFSWGGHFETRRSLVITPEDTHIPEWALQVAPGAYVATPVD